MQAAQRGPCSRRRSCGYVHAVTHRCAQRCRPANMSRAVCVPRGHFATLGYIGHSFSFSPTRVHAALPRECVSLSVAVTRRATHCCTCINARLSSHVNLMSLPCVFRRNARIPRIEISEKAPSRRKIGIPLRGAALRVRALQRRLPAPEPEDIVARCELCE